MADVQSSQHQLDRVRSVPDADRMIQAEEGGKLPLKALHLRPQDVVAAFQHPLHRSSDRITPKPLIFLRKKREKQR